MNNIPPVDQKIKEALNAYLDEISAKTNSDVMAVMSPVYPGLENRVKTALGSIEPRKKSLVIILETSGGVVEVVERMVTTIRYLYDEISFVVPNRAMSAGTVFVMSGDRIYMDYFSCLGPIDPQVEKDGKLVPALSYLLEFERLNKKAAAGQLTSAEFALLEKLDLAELHLFQQARELSIELLEKWLSTYKFKDWLKTKSKGKAVTEEMRKTRAKEIAEKLSKNERWHSHARGISMETLQKELNLQIEDLSLEKYKSLYKSITEYYDLLTNYINREKHSSFIHTKSYF
jgi:membrane-bound ClpP family serine protease